MQVVWLNVTNGDEGYPNKEYTVVTGIVDLDDYSDSDVEKEVRGYYESLEQMCESYNVPVKCWTDLDQIIAECIFELWENFSSHEMFTKEGAIKFAEQYMKEAEQDDTVKKGALFDMCIDKTDNQTYSITNEVVIW